MSGSATRGRIIGMLMAKAHLERCHWNAIQEIGWRQDHDAEHWMRLSSMMLATVGAHLENLPGLLKTDVDGIAPLEVEDRLRTECGMASDAISGLVVHASWHPEGRPEEGWHRHADEGILHAWMRLCAAVAASAGVETAYGVPAAPARRPATNPGMVFQELLRHLRGPFGIRPRIDDRKTREIWMAARLE